jgi:pimeloyl-ACP methyl ester carboxylesterase
MAIPSAEEVVFEHSAHMIPYEEPEAFFRALRGFLSRI